MKKYSIFALALSLILLLSACGTKEAVDYTQAVLPEPEQIKITSGNNTIFYEKGEEKYEKIWSTLSRNWWMTAEGEPDTAAQDALIPAESADALRTTSNRTYVTASDTIVWFLYEEEPLRWTTSDAEILDAEAIGFVMPGVVDSDSNVKGFFLVMQDAENFGTSQGIYTYYYAPEIAAGFWSFMIG